MALKDFTHVISLFLFRIGQLILITGYMCFIIGIMTSKWVVRPAIDYAKRNVDPAQVKVVEFFGIFTACKQSPNASGSGDCGSMADLINFVDGDAIRLVQAMMIIGCILYIFGFVVELIQILPLSLFRNFLAENRVVEMFSGIATVLGLVAMVIYAGEVKNKAELIPGQEDESVGWSFVIAIVGLSLCILGLLMITMFRHLPVSTDNDSHPKGGSWLRKKESNPVH